MSKRHSRQKAVKSKVDTAPGGNMNWLPPSSRQRLVGSDDPIDKDREDDIELDETILREMISEILRTC
jgi:hypothetical protein